MKISVYEPLLSLGNEHKYLSECISSGWVSSDGYFVQKFEEEFAEWSGNKYAIAVCNGTAALETALWSARITSGKVALCTSTIISCALAILRTGGEPLFFDNNDMTIAKGGNTTALMNVHLFGHFFKSSANIPTIDDASQYWKPFKVQDVACYSLYANKLITSGEGGIIVTNKKEIYERAKSYRNLCHSKERFVHNNLGYNFRMSNLQAAVALAQLEQIDKFTEIKQKNRDLYLKYLPEKVKPLFDVPVPWMYIIETPFDAGEMIKKIARKEIDCRGFFYPLHKQPCFKGKYEHLNLPNSEYAWGHWFYLPSGLTLTETQIIYICKCLKNTLNSTI